eukprot:scaffold2017_cov387-Prasinococcus_capsulatus_cf.AAC.4
MGPMWLPMLPAAPLAMSHPSRCVSLGSRLSTRYNSRPSLKADRMIPGIPGCVTPATCGARRTRPARRCCRGHGCSVQLAHVPRQGAPSGTVGGAGTRACVAHPQSCAILLVIVRAGRGALCGRPASHARPLHAAL